MSKQQAPIPLYFAVPFFQAPNDIFDIPDITEHEAHTYLYLCRVWNNRNPCFPSLPTIAQHCHFSPRTASKAIKSLQLQGLIAIHHVQGSHDSNEYRICTEYFVNVNTQRSEAQEREITNHYVRKHPDTAMGEVAEIRQAKIFDENGILLAQPKNKARNK